MLSQFRVPANFLVFFHEWSQDALYILNIEAETKYPPFPKHFQTHFLDWKWYFDENFIEICPSGPNQQYFSISSDYGLLPTRRQAIFCTNDG